MISERPEYHFTPAQNWMNDPNGLIYHQGIYHLYYQHNPLAPYFGNISWGHATSSDLRDWKHQPLALKSYETKSIYSGCVIFDHNNLLKQNKPSLVAIYTEHDGDEVDYHEMICLAISKDDGETFDQVSRQVILQDRDPDFRDPKVFYHQVSRRWIMVVALPKQYLIRIYSSDNLTNWTHQSDFTSEAPRDQYWECPDLFALIDEKGNEHWILSISGANYQGRQRGWGMFYFIGHFDGKVFSNTTFHQWLDFGRDFYAGITFEGTGKEKTMMSWCNNWLTANQPHSRNWSGIMSSPRKLKLHQGHLIHKMITDIEPIVINPKPVSKVSLPRNQCQLTIDHDTIRISKGDRLIDQRTMPHHIYDCRIYEDHGIIEILINEGQSATWLV